MKVLGKQPWTSEAFKHISLSGTCSVRFYYNHLIFNQVNRECNTSLNTSHLCHKLALQSFITYWSKTFMFRGRQADSEAQRHSSSLQTGVGLEGWWGVQGSVRQTRGWSGSCCIHWGRALRMALTSSATAVRANSNWSWREQERFKARYIVYI